MIDTLARFLPLAQARPAVVAGLGRYTLVTLHRPSNVDDDATLSRLARALVRISQRLPVVFPVHPRTRERLAALAGAAALTKASDIVLTEPLGYLDFLALEQAATVVITDSGGIQEETTYLGVPCLTLRENTERPITVSMGTNTLVGFDYDRLEREVGAIFAGSGKQGRISPLWDGKTAGRIADVLATNLGGIGDA
jgi:UDP-N-acetylglucosamine 2-epimerase (non-hydrolysing)